MIRVNLLPPEHRPAQGTPFGHFVAILASILLALGGAGFWAWTHLIQLPGARDLKSMREDEHRAMLPRVQHSRDLQAELKVYQERRNAIQTINRNRVLWSKKLDQFFEIVALEQGGYQAWLEDLNVPNQSTSSVRGRPAAGKQAADGGRFIFNGRLAMQNVNDAPAQGSLFYKRMVGETDAPSEFFQDFLGITNPAPSIEDNGREDSSKERLDPPVVAAIRYELRLQPRDLGRPKQQAGAGKPPAPVGAQPK